MKSWVFILLVFISSAFGGVGGLGGGPKNLAVKSQYVSEYVCSGGESGTLCARISYKVRPAGQVKETDCYMTFGEATFMSCTKAYQNKTLRSLFWGSPQSL